MRERARDVPMRPKPLMATLILASVVVLTAAAWCVEGRRGSATGRCLRVETSGVPHGARRFPRNRAASRNNSRDARRRARTLTALPRLRPAVWPRNSTWRREGDVGRVPGQSRASRRRRARATPAMPSAGPPRHTRIGLFFARVARQSRPETRVARAPRARGGSTRGRTFREGVVAAKAAILLVMGVKGDGCVRV